MQLGELKVSYVPDGVVRLNALRWLPSSTAEFWAANAEYVDDAGDLIASIGGLLVEHGDRALLIDAGFGPRSFSAEPGNAHGAIRGGALLDNLATLGRTPDDIEAVAITHLHIDHLGWLWRDAEDEGRPPFAKADILITEPEWGAPELAAEQGTGPEILKAMAPQVRTTTDGEEIFPGVRVRLIPGHTAGHAAYSITSGGQRLLAFGDALHTPAQVGHPELSAAPDLDSARSAAFRRGLVAELADAPDTIGFGGHFADVVFGRVRRDGERAVWVPEPE
ncbi:MBL fold metallo-hydrolase [Actinomadura rudentiformis]|uniref:MBL fold metallo-hydrolase n=1 Tax=Actinomadura rudentiformis TaxID=359158 RepID=A0A6H9YY41_9ACTN|nr:MBL fold metallo-hydrolase [Actinomadura rudentiformis]